jgi:dienelactone hydrolase
MRLTLVLVALLAMSTACGNAVAQQKVQFAALDGKDGAAPTVLDAYLFRPDGSGPRPAIVFMHGCGGLFARTTDAIVSRETAWRQQLVDKGFVVLMVDGFTPRETGEMCSRTGFKEWLYLRRPGDAYAALVYLQAQDFVTRDRIGLMGWSNGGGAVLMAVANQSRGRPASFAEPDFRAAVAFYPGSCSEQRLGADWTTSIPLLILIGQEDVWTPAKPCQELAQDAVSRGAPVTFHAYPGAYHDFDWPGLKRRELTSYATRAGIVPITGEDPAARVDALDRVTTFLTRHILN